MTKELTDEQYDKISEMAEELRDYAYMDGTEWSDTMFALVNLSKFLAYFTPGFANAIGVEIESQLNNVKENAEIKEFDVSEHIMARTIRSLEWK